MKKYFLSGIIAVTCWKSVAEPPRFLSISEPRVKDQGFHHRTIDRVSEFLTSYGRVIYRTNTYQEIGTGINFWDGASWRPTEERLEIVGGGAAAVATNGPHLLIVSPSVADLPALDINTIDNVPLRCRLWGLVLKDAFSGVSVLVAEPNPESVGALAGDNRIVYDRALDDIAARLEVTYKKSGIESELVLLERIEPRDWPALANAEPQDLRLQVWTEWFDMPEPGKETVVVRQEPEGLRRQLMAEKDIVDETISFGQMRFIPGSAFRVAEENEPGLNGALSHRESVPVYKQWVKAGIPERTFLVETVEWRAIAPLIAGLPLAGNVGAEVKGLAKRKSAKTPAELVSLAGKNIRSEGNSGRIRREILTGDNRDSGGRTLPEGGPSSRAIQLAKAPGVSIDWTLVTAQSNTVLKADTTYFCVSDTILSGTTVLEPCVVKYTNFSALPRLLFNGPIDVRTTNGHPAIFTSWMDNSVGEVIGSVTNVPNTNRYASDAIRLMSSGTTFDLHDVHIRYADFAVSLVAGSLTLSHAQIGYGVNGVALHNSILSSSVRNVLFHNLVTAFRGSGSHTNRGENITVHQVGGLHQGGKIFLTNSLLIACTNRVTEFQGVNVETNLSDVGYFQTVSAGKRYLATDSPFRGTATNVSAALATELKLRTTWPPAQITNDIIASTNFNLQVPRDVDAKDWGYHYSPIDYLIGNGAGGSGITLSNATLLLTNSVAVAFSAATNWGLRMANAATLVGQGDPLGLCKIFWSHCAQETPVFTGTNGVPIFSDTYPAPATPGTMNLRFTSIPMMSGSYLFNQENNRGTFSTLRFQDCQFGGGRSWLFPSVTNQTMIWHNNLFDRLRNEVSSYTPQIVEFSNNLFREGSLSMSPSVDGQWLLYDNFFDKTTIWQASGITFSNNFNAYITNHNRLSPTGANDIVLTVTNADYQAGPLGRYYYPASGGSLSQLINAGSVSAASNGLYWFCTTTNQTPETNSTCDIGFHYVALSGGQPLDDDADGRANWYEDANGNGFTDPGELCFHDPRLTIASTLDYVKGSPPKLLDTNATVLDTYSSNFDGGQLRVTITAGADSNDRLSIRNQGTNAAQIGISGTNVTYGSTNIGNFFGGQGTNALVVAFNTNAIVAAVQALARNLMFHNISNNPAASTRILRFDLTDGDGGTNMPVYQTINIVCPVAIDAMMVIDISNSMEPDDFAQAKEAASNFVSRLRFSSDRVGLISFAGYAYLNSPLTNNGPLVQSMIVGLTNTAGTTFHYAFDLATNSLAQTPTNVLPLIILLSDGKVGTTNASGNQVETETNRIWALERAAAIKDAGIRMITIAYGTNSGLNEGTNLMQVFASSTNDYYYAPSASQIDSNYNAISIGLCLSNLPPAVAITSPTNNEVFIAASSITVTATASDADGIAVVEFFNGTSKIGEDLASPYSVNWQNPPAGTNQLTARAVDSLGLSATSAVVNVIIRVPPNISILSPADNTAFAATPSFEIKTNPKDYDGQVTRVEFLNGSSSLGIVTNLPFHLTWSNVSVGSYTLKAIATDNDNLMSTSAPVAVSVTTCSNVGLYSLSLNPSSLYGSLSATGTLTLNAPAPTGGQAVSLTCTSSVVSLPATVLVPAGASNVSFQIDTRTVSTDVETAVEARLYGSTLAAALTLLATNWQSSNSVRGLCGPMDVAFVVVYGGTWCEYAGSGGGLLNTAEENVQRALSNAVDVIEFASDSDYRLALVGVTTASNRIMTEFAMTNREAFLTNVPSLTCNGYDNWQPPYDEALNMVINNLTDDNRPMQSGDFTNAFRAEARKVIVLLVDKPPVSYTNYFYPGIDDVNTHWRAVEAWAKGIEICAITLTTHDVFPETFAIMQDCAVTSGGAYAHGGFFAATLEVELRRVLSQCGAELGEVVVVRDDDRRAAYLGVTLTDSQKEAAATDLASFNTAGLDGEVVAARLRRSGQIRVNYGSRFDLQIGAACALQTNIASYGILITNAEAIAAGAPYSHEWELPFSFFSDLEGSFTEDNEGNKGTYLLKLTDRASAACGNNFEVIDIPGADFPTNRKTLTLKVRHRFEIPQGRCQDFVLTGTNVPTSADWEIYLFDRLVASSCLPKGWSVEPDYTAYGGFNICVPTNATVAKQYEVKYLDGAAGRSGFFEITAGGTGQDADSTLAPVLLPLQVSASIYPSNSTVAAKEVVVALDGPAPRGGAVVSLSSTGPVTGVPRHVVIPAGKAHLKFSFSTLQVQSNSTYEVTASYNGTRKSTGVIVYEAGVGPWTPQDVQVLPGVGRILLSWSSVTNALYYYVDRSPNCGAGPWLTVADKLTTTCFIDENVEPGSNYCYQVFAVNSFGQAGSLCDLPNGGDGCTQAATNLLRPVISPPGGKFYDRVTVSISNQVPNATVRYTTNGLSPTTNDMQYTGPFVLSSNAIVIARTFLGQDQSADAKRDFVINNPRPFSCGSNVVLSLALTNWPSPIRGLLSERFSFAGIAGQRVTITVSTGDFDPFVLLVDPSGKVVAEKPIKYTPGKAEIVYTLVTNGTFVIDVTGYIGVFSLSLNCEPFPLLSVLVDGTAISNFTILDMGITPTNVPLNKTLTITNWGATNATIMELYAQPTPPFSLSTNTLPPLAPATSTNLVLSFNSGTTGLFSGSFFLMFSGGLGFESISLDLLARANPAGTPPTVSLTNPTNGQMFTVPTNVVVTATASATSPSTVSQVDFYSIGPNGTVLIGSDATSPYSITNGFTISGNYTVRTFVSDTGGRVGLPSSVNISFNNPPVPSKDFLAVITGSSSNELEVISNDRDPDKDPLTITAVGSATNGTASLSGGKIFYTPNSGTTGRDLFIYTISDGRGGTATTNIIMQILPPWFPEDMDQVANITYPTNDTEITAPVDVIGTVASPYLQYYQVQYRRRSAIPSGWTTFGESDTSLTNTTLGVFDPTGLPNGIYEMRARATDWIDGTTTESYPITVQVGEAMKVGHFTVSFNDLQIPVSGLPITLVRTYDSRDTEAGDFGAGWRLEVRSAKLEKTGPLGTGWTLQPAGWLNDCVYPTEPHLVTITLGNDQKFKFDSDLDVNYSGGPCTVLGGIAYAQAGLIFKALPGTTGTLAPVNHPGSLNFNTLDTNNVTLHEDRGNISILGPIYDPAEFIFTTLDGRKLQFNAQGQIVKMTDRNTNTLTFGRDGIIHSSGKSVKFVRDAAGRITEIYDPNGLNASGEPSGPAAIIYRYDDLGNLIAVHRLTDRNATTNYLPTTFAYENAKNPNYLTSITDARGVTGIRNEYDDSGRLISSTDANGNKITYIHDVNGRKETIVDRMGNTNIFSYDTRGNVTNSVNALGQTNLYSYDSNNNKTSETNPLGEKVAYTYDSNNLLLSVSNAVGTINFSYNQLGQPLTVIDALGRGETNGYDNAGNLIAMTNALGARTTYTRDANGNATSQKDHLNNITTNQFDAFGNVTNVMLKEANGSILSTASCARDLNGNLTNLIVVRTLPGGGVTNEIIRFICDAENRVTETIDPDGKTNRVVYNEIGKQQQTIDKLGRTNGYEYDLRGNLAKIVQPDLTADDYAYDSDGRRTFQTNQLGFVTQFIHDALGRVTHMIYPDRTTNVTIYDAAGRVRFTVDARGVTNAFGYDAAGRRIAETNALGTPVEAVTRYAYNAVGNLTNVVNALGRSTDFEYDGLSRRVKTIFPATLTGQPRPFTTTGYDLLNRPVAETNEAGVITRLGYDGAGRLVAVTNAWGTADATWALYAYDESGNQTNQVDALGRVTKFDFDSLGRRVKRILPAGQSEMFGYDLAGNLIAHTNFNGLVITNRFDSMNRLLSRHNGTNGAVLETYAYSVSGQVTGRVDSSGSYSFMFDERDRLKTNAGPVATLTYAYDANGNLLTIKSSTPNGTDVAYQYDALNRVTNVVDNQLTGTKNTQYAFDAIANLVSLRYPNGVTNHWQHDARNRLTNLVWKLNTATLASFLYQLGIAGNRTNLSDTVNNSARTYAWQYDALYRLTNETVSGSSPTGTLGYRYDPVGNRTNRSGTLGALAGQTFSYTANDWLNTDVYDLAGNTRTNGGSVYLYDWANRLTNANNGAVVIVYNGAGDRASKTVGGTTTLYLVDLQNLTGYPQVLEELTVSGGVTNLSRAYTYGLDLISQRIPNTSTNFFGYDGLGSTRFLVGPNGAITEAYAYDAYGSLIASNGLPATAYLFAGEQWDRDLGLYYKPARLLNPETGRFWTMDTFEGFQSDPLSLHKYLYVHSDPVNGLDPSGHMNMASVLSSATVMFTVAANMYIRHSYAINRAVVVGYEAATGETVALGKALHISKVQGGISSWVKALNRVGRDVVIGPYSYVKNMLRGTGRQAHHLNQKRAYTEIHEDLGACVDLGGSVLEHGTEHNQFHVVMERFWAQYRKDGPKFRRPVSNKEYLEALREALTAVKSVDNAGKTVPKFRKEQIDGMVELAEKQQLGHGYHDGPKGLRPEVPKSTNAR